MLVVAVVGVLDVACGLVLFLEGREISFSFATHKKKTNNDTD
jgi:hypothetical protein